MRERHLSDSERERAVRESEQYKGKEEVEGWSEGWRVGGGERERNAVGLLMSLTAAHSEARLEHKY